MYLNSTYRKNKSLATLCIATIMMVAPATAYTNLNNNENSLGTTLNSAEATAPVGAWVTTRGLHPNTDTLITAISDASKHGLNPDYYQLSSLEQDLEKFVEKSEHLGEYITDDSASARKSLEKRLYKAFSLYVTDLGRGALDAQKTQRNLYREAPKVDTAALKERLDSGESTVRELLNEVTPSSPYYKNLVKHMEVLLKERDSGKIRTRVTHHKDLKLGDTHSAVIDLRSRLKETGDLDSESQLSTYFGNDIEQALIAVQTRHGLTPTGEFTEATVAVLNDTVDDDITEVAMNLERWRWMPRELGDRHILINIPSYNLTMMNGDQSIVDMAVVVGSKKHKTPVFSKGAQYVEVAPTWTVPASITNNELIPIERKRPGYLESERMDFFSWSNGKLIPVPRSQVTAADFQKKVFPYVLRQRAGDDNALGKIKILMPNKYAIYMHDTQAKSLFAKTDRAYSHGCIRLSDPFRLGSLLLQLDGNSPETTQELLAKEKTTRVKLNDKTPTHIAYFTAWIGDDGKLQKRKDVYQYNKSLISGLKADNTLLSTLKSRPISVLAEQVE